VELVEVDRVDAHPAQAGVAGLDDPVRREPAAAGIGDGEAALRRQHDLVAVVRQPRRERLLGAAVGVDVGGVDEVAAGLEEAVEHPVRLVGGGLGAHQHRPDAQPADRERAQLCRLHAVTITRARTRHCVTIDAMPDLLPGAEIAGCRIEAVAGRGGMGIVYRATQLSLGRPVAVKLIAPDRAGDPGFRERFERESRIAAAIDHPNVIPVYAAGEEGGHLYLVMRYVKGTDLQGLLAREHRLRPDQVAAIALQVGAALDAAHAVGLVHRDVKPANVLLGGEHAYLADFGLSQIVGSETRLTSTGQWIGTVDFMAPEQFSGDPVDARADSYALGCVLYTALTGATPYPRGTVPATMLAHMHDDPPRPTQVAPGVPTGFDRVIARALAKDPADRYLSAGDLGRAALAAAEGRPVTESERTVARGAAAPQARSFNGNGAPTAVLAQTGAAAAPPPQPARARTEQAPGVTMPLGERPRRRRRRRWGTLLLGAAATGAAAAAVIALADPGAGVDPQRLPGAPVADGEVEALANDFAAAYAKEDGAALGRLLTRDAERVVPGARQEGRAEIVRAYRRQFDDADTRSFKLEELAAEGGATGRASARFVATYAGEPDVTGTIVFGVLRDRGTPRIALISARQDPPAS
jgi:serine/threonine-protein kinase